MKSKDRRKKKFHGVFDGGAFVRDEKGMRFERRIIGLAHWCPGCKKPHVLHKGDFQFDGEPDTPTVRPAAIFPDCAYIITNGKIYFLLDCTHSLAGRVVDMPEWRVEDARVPEIPAVLS